MKLNVKNILFTSSALLCLQSAVLAEVTLKEVNITETTFNSQVKSITAQKLENLQASDIKDILKTLPSVVVDGNARYSQKVYVRGLEDKFSNITIDGAKLGGQLFHHSGDQTIDAEMLKIGSIELGPNSALSGSGVINGSFVYETKDPSDFLKQGENFGGKISAGYQSAYERKSTSVAVFSRINDKLEFVGIGNISKDGDLHIPKKKEIKSKESKLKSALAKVVFKPNEYHTIKLSYNRYEDGGKRQLSGEKAGNYVQSNDPYNEITRDTYTLNYNYNPTSEYINVDAKAYYNSQQLMIEGRKNTDWWTDANKANEPQRVFENKTKGLDIRNSSLISNHKITFGSSYETMEQKLDAKGDRVYTEGPKIGESESLDKDGGKTKAYGFYLEDEIELDKFLLTIGARYDIHKLSGEYNGSYKQLSPKFKGEYQATQNLKLRTGYGRIFKGPDLAETLMLNSRTLSNENTKAQTGHNYEVGFDYNLTNFINSDDSSFGFTAFKYNVDNYMHPTKNTSLENQSDVKIWGLESIFRYKKSNFGLNLSHTYTNAEEKSLKTGTKYEPKTANIHTFKLGLDYQFTKNLIGYYNAEFVLGNEYEYYNSRNDSVSTVQRKGYGVHDINFSYKLDAIKNAKIDFGLDNIFNKQYARHTSFGTAFGDDSYTPYEVGRNFKIKLSYRF
ncbi:TonB-dependent receptor [Malaciobacter mytili]|uniref:TonB-dependent receptor domain-containing protein n=1 Tax=Malaciobacter mytili TaxID=603050 RepID=UPI003BAE56F7